jgi:tRNA A-37 threonylcarbamoyl transferase component Bud32
MSREPSWERLDQLFDEGLAIPASERGAWLRAACADDDVLRARLERMFAAHDSPGFLDRPLARPATQDLRARVSDALAARYQIIETLGTGGMASVFRAREIKHDRSVVIKVLEPTLGETMGDGRFLDEVRIAARLSHPHILTFIDSGEVDGLLYYVMPFVGGETMRDRLAASGPRPVQEAVALLRDVADALAYAHASGIVHRDLKPGNVLCVGDHAFLFDFGIAKFDTDGERPHATMPGVPIGTPGYMAPEQAASRPVDHRADIYAWGLLARELFTGTRTPERPLQELRPDAPRSLVALVEACLAIDPAERPQSAHMLVAALDALITTRRPRPWWRLAAAAALLVAVGALALRDRTPAVPEVGSIAGPIAVLPLRNETGDSALAGWGRLAGDWVTQGLHEAGLAPVVPWPTMLITAADVRPDGADPVALARRQTGAATIVTGSYYRTDDSLRFQASITDARTGRLLAAIPPVVVALDSAAAAVRELRDRLMGAVAVSFDERLPTALNVSTTPPTWDAYRLFDQALIEFNAYRYDDASEGFVAAWRRDSSFVPALIYAALATTNSGDVPLGDSLIREVLARRAKLSTYHAALADFIEAYLAGDRGRALAPIQRAMALAPGSRASYSAAYILLQLNRPAEAAAMLRQLDPDHGPMRDWPSYWSQRAYAAHLLGDHADELGLAREMKRRFPAQRVAWVIEARALAAMGRHAALDSLLQAASTLEPDVYWSQGAMRVVAAEEYEVHASGDSMAAYRDAAAWFESRLADLPKDRNHRSWLSQAMLGLRQFERAEQLLDELDREGPERIFQRGQLAALAARRGNGPLAMRRLGNSPGSSHGEFAIYQARVAALLGRRDEAFARLSEGLRLGVYNWHWQQHAMQRDLASLADDPRYARLLAPIPPPQR